MSTAVRVDTVKNQLAALQTMLGTIRAELDDLHALAWERSRTTDDTPGRGGDRDYALDTHGNPTARAALNGLKTALTKTCQDLALALDEASYVLRHEGEQSNTSRTLITRAEHADALVAQLRRIERGEGSHRRLPQPGRDRALKALEQRATKAEAEAKGLRRRLDRAEAALAARDRRTSP